MHSLWPNFYPDAIYYDFWPNFYPNTIHCGVYSFRLQIKPKVRVYSPKIKVYGIRTKITPITIVYSMKMQIRVYTIRVKINPKFKVMILG